MHMLTVKREWTFDDLSDLPDAGNRDEVIDGELFVSPAPPLRHREAVPSSNRRSTCSVSSARIIPGTAQWTSARNTMTRPGRAQRKRWPPSKTALDALIEEATIDASGESEQCVGLFTMIDEHLTLPFDVEVLGVVATVERIDMPNDARLVAVCRRGRSRQAISLLDLPIPMPPPAGAEWIEAYRRWARCRY